MRRTHISAVSKPFDILPWSDFNSQPVRLIDMKPPGLWYEVDGGWRDWCETESPHWLVERHLHKLHFGTEHMLVLRTVEDIDWLTEEYASIPDRTILRYINWARVMEIYDGIEIAPYQWERRLSTHTMWYYSWDCASGVIWRPKGARLEYIGPI